ncbi:MAG: hypothetical protein FE044_02250 [Thermoplasmata archaeon]|nr:MAG: hypothetical protein FE044_02250 [Thermoplasmata archaeon]
MKKPKRHLLLATMLLLLSLLAYFLDIIGWKLEIIFLIFIFPYLSFSLIFANAKTQKKKNAIDVIKRRYST